MLFQRMVFHEDWFIVKWKQTLDKGGIKTNDFRNQLRSQKNELIKDNLPTMRKCVAIPMFI